MGSNSEAEVDAWYNNLLEQFRKTGNQKGIDLIEQLLPLKKADAQLNTIASKINQIRTQQAIREQSIQAQVTSNMITQIEAQAQLVKLHKATAQELAEYLPLLEKMAEKPGEVGIAGQKAAAQLKLEMAELNQTTNVLTNALRSGLQSGIQSGLEGLARGTYTLSDAVSNLGQSIASSMAQIASQGLTEIMMSGLDSLGSSLFSSTDTALDSASSTVAATEMNTAIITGAATGGTTLNTSITTGATAGAAELNTSISTAATVAATEINTVISAALSVGATEISTSLATAFTTGTVELTSSLSASFITGAATLATAITTASAAASLSGAAAGAGGAAVAAVATGGYISGPGTSTSDSIPARLSNGEYVVKADAVKKYGVDYLHAINTGRLHHYASGGAVTHTRTPNAPKIDDEPAKNSQTAQTINPVIQQTLLIDSGEMLSSGISSLAGSRAMMTWIRANKPTLRQELS